MKLSALVFAAASFLGFTAQAFAVDAFSLPWLNGPARDSVYNTADHPDGIFAIEGFQNFCPHCHNNAPAVEALAAKYKSQARVQVVGLDLDTDQGEVDAWMQDVNPSYVTVQDAQGTVGTQIGADQGIPAFVITDCKGNIKYQTAGEWDDQANADIAQTIDTLLSQTCSATVTR